MENNNNQTAPQNPVPKSNKNAIIAVVVVVVLLIVVGNFVKGLFGRKISQKIGEGVVEKIVESQTGSDVDLKNGSVSFSGKDGDFEIGTTAQWPADMPNDVPKFSSGEITAAVRINNENVNGWSVVMKDVTENAAGDYVKQLEGAGWKSAGNVSLAATIYQLTKGDYKLNLVYDPSSKGVNLMVELDKKTQ